MLVAIGTRIHIDHNGVETYAATQPPTKGHNYSVLAGETRHELAFQNGPVHEVGLNGLTNESLLAVLAHRIRFLDAKSPCMENERALHHVQLALQWLETRTANRKARGVEGTNVA